jgi:arylsulfatase A-like enzyme
MKKYSILALSLAVPTVFAAQENRQQEAKPNVLFVVFDDIGWGDMGYNGSTLVPTPNFDRLASMGVSFSDGYVTAPISGPSRSGMVSGMYQQRFGMQINADYRTLQIPEEQKTLPETMKMAGYNTALVGKWHVCRKPEIVFDEVYEPIEISSNYFPNTEGQYDKARLPILCEKPVTNDDEYMTDRLTNRAINFIDKNKNSSFFLYLGYNAAHNPWQAAQKYYDKLPDIKEEYMRVYAAILASADDNLGRLLDYLDENKLTDNTIIVMVCDNGPAKGGPELKTWDGYDPSRTYIFGQTGGLRGHKVDLYEGGIRTPMVMAYKPRLREGKIFKDMISSLDFYPTICELANIDIPEKTHLDGVSLVKYLREETKQQPHDFLFWKRVKNGAARMGTWKLCIDGDKSELYSLRDDIGETKDLSEEYASIKKRMLKAWQEWKDEMPENTSKLQVRDNDGQGE